MNEAQRSRHFPQGKPLHVQARAGITRPMSDPFFFGYGSLVNRATHAYAQAAPAVANGWRRAWVHTDTRPQAYLTAVRATGQRITGLIAAVPNGDWAELDMRESGYDRIAQTDNISHTQPDVAGIAIYAVPPQASSGVAARHPILLSYLDVVLQGYLREFGPEGAQDFIDTTDGWETPVLDDRAAPRYPRHQTLAPAEIVFVDAALDRLGSRRIKP